MKDQKVTSEQRREGELYKYGPGHHSSIREEFKDREVHRDPQTLKTVEWYYNVRPAILALLRPSLTALWVLYVLLSISEIMLYADCFCNYRCSSCRLLWQMLI